MEGYGLAISINYARNYVSSNMALRGRAVRAPCQMSLPGGRKVVVVTMAGTACQRDDVGGS